MVVPCIRPSLATGRTKTLIGKHLVGAFLQLSPSVRARAYGVAPSLPSSTWFTVPNVVINVLWGLSIIHPRTAKIRAQSIAYSRNKIPSDSYLDGVGFPPPTKPLRLSQTMAFVPPMSSIRNESLMPSCSARSEEH